MASVEPVVQVTFGDLLRRYRLAAGLSQEALAERARISARAISDLERGTHQAPYRDTVRLLAEALGLAGPARAEFESTARSARRPRRSSDSGSATAATATAPVSGTSQGPSRDGSLADGLLATKLGIPMVRSTLVPRPRLIDRLARGLRGPLTLLSAPAGSGKTTLLGAWRATAEGAAMPMAWVSLDAGDNEPARFWGYICTALDALRPGSAAAALAMLQSPQPPAAEVFLIGVINAFATLTEDHVLALDDYHVIESPPIHQGLGFLLEHLPSSLHLLLATRADPPLPLARWQARGVR